MRRATLHLICGLAGAGKTTFAMRLEQDRDAVRFSPDEWMVTLYGHDPPSEHFQTYFQGIMDLVWPLARRLLSLGIDVILDHGFWTRVSRDNARLQAREVGAESRLYVLVAPENVMRQRVLQRTNELPEGALYIDEAAFELFKQRFEPPGSDEPHIQVPGA